MTRVEAYQALAEFEAAMRAYEAARVDMERARAKLQGVLHEAYPLPGQE